MAASSERIAMRARRWLRLATAVLCGAFLVALTLVTVVDVIGRYLLSSPLPGAAEYTEILLMAIVFVGLPAVCLDDGHVSVDLLTAGLRGVAERIQLNLARLVVAVVLGLVSWQLWNHGAQLDSYNEVTVYLRAPLGPFAKATAVITGVCAVITLVMAVLRLPKSDGGGV
ncbi:TRAP dicarboxylate transporter subunit DctQ [Nitratireductor aquibiodomus RA22]|uniref:TRAP transporter small permease protein n=1 Tax=Nitratireductor aquibiodomus RA22 TaxID=1189611 RepID=I5BW34_9HYPH|nr:TRAP transporter small permease [Nitratireductor aquibiodomus]EIM73786.1 TRAP dicarboxylate transporter subunit DctQ [Nitratireductor aquibiodomus RA22]